MLWSEKHRFTYSGGSTQWDSVGQCLGIPIYLPPNTVELCIDDSEWIEPSSAKGNFKVTDIIYVDPIRGSLPATPILNGEVDATL